MTQMNTWSNLMCPCGSEKFIHMITLRWTNGSGTVTVPSSYRCAECHKDMDAAKLIAELTLRQKRKELEQLQEEVGHADTGRAVSYTHLTLPTNREV